MSLADWINRYVVEFRPSTPPPSKPTPAAGRPAPAPRRVADLLPPAEATPPDPEIEALLAEARQKPRPPAADPPAPAPAEPAPPAPAPAPAPTAGDPLDDGGDPPVKVEQVYAVAKIGKPAHGFTLERIASMLQDPRLAALDERARASAVAVLLESAGVSIAQVVEDAAARDQALDKFERFLEEKVQKVEAEVQEENRRLAEEIERLIARKREEVARNEARALEKRRELARFRRVKREEERRLFDVVRPFTADNPVTLSDPPPPAEPAPTSPAPGPSEPAATPVDAGQADTGVFKAQPLPPTGADPYAELAARLRKEREGS